MSKGEKHIATINTKIVIFPDKVCYDTESDEFSSLEASCSCYPGDVSFQSNSLTVLGTSYADIAKEEEGVLSAIPADTSFSAYTAVSIDKASGKVTLSNLSIKTPDRLQAGDLIQYGCDKEKEYMIRIFSTREPTAALLSSSGKFLTLAASASVITASGARKGRPSTLPLWETRKTSLSMTACPPTAMRWRLEQTGIFPGASPILPLSFSGRKIAYIR